MGDLTHKAIDDLKAQLAAAQEEAEQQRTRAEAAEQELRDYTAHVAQSKNEDRSKFAAIRAHLAGVHVEEIAGAWRIRRMAMRLAESSFDREAIAGQASAIHLAECALFDAAEKLLAAAREALEP